ncbi:MAG: hypothetical protein ACTSRP_12855 [Candidatus Helarchaeota archaeon]
MMLISNSSPIIHLTRIGKIEYLISKEKKILIPNEVYKEVVIQGKQKDYLEAFLIEKYINNGKIEVIELKDFNKEKYPPLGKGEIESLELALKMKCLLIIDDKKARNIAKILKIPHQTTIATIFDLLISKEINFSDFRENIKKLAEDNWISADVIQEFLEKGEKYGK